MGSIMGAKKFQLLFRRAASLDVDKSDLKRLTTFLNHKLHDLITVAEAAAKENGRDIILPHDLPITQGLENSMHEFKSFEIELELSPILEQLATMEPHELECAEETNARMPYFIGGLTISLAKTFKVLDPQLKNPREEHWESVFEIFDMLL